MSEEKSGYEITLERIAKVKKTGGTELDLSGLKLESLPPELWEIKHLTNLDLGGNLLAQIPSAVAKLTQLTSLILCNNNLVALPDEIGKLGYLASLDLSNNHIYGFPPEFGKLSNLTVLDLSRNHLTCFCPELLQLRNLVSLDLGVNEITELPSGIGELSNLTSLDLRVNKLAGLPPEIGQLASLISLDVSINRLTSIPPEIGQLSNLAKLKLSVNQLTNIPSEISQLSKLISLNLLENLLTDLPSSLQKMTWLKTLDLYYNYTLPLPPEILAKKNEPQKILSYLSWVQAGKPKQLAETKLMVLGQGSVGKTSLVKRLTSGQFNPHENKTNGIAINHWQVPDQSETENQQSEIRVNIWDFGGQEIMHATHQFFLSHRSLYLLVLDSRQTPEENRLEYWLKIIQSFGGNSPVIVVGNKSDQHPLDLDRASLREKYPQIAAILEASAATGAGLDELKAAIAQQVNTLPHVRDQIPETWFNVKNALEELGRAQNFISEEKFAETCAIHEINEAGSQRTLLGFLHDLGVLLHFQDDPRLESLGILNPVWVTDGVYKILNAPAFFQAQGVLPLSMLGDILPPGDYPRNKHLFLIDLMKRFELCYDLERDKTFLLPDLLPKQPPATGDWDDALAFLYEYPVLPTSVMTRFIVRMNAHIAGNLVWRNGVALQLDANRAMLKADPNEHRLTIRVSGPEHTRRDALAVIRHQLDTIHASMKGLIPERKIPVPGHPGIEPLRYEYLLELERDGIPILPVFDGQRNIKVDIKQLLNGIESEEVRRLTYVNISGSVGGSVVVGDGNTLETGK
jgi:internalin A